MMDEFDRSQWLMECGCEINCDWAGYGVSTDLTQHHNWKIIYCPQHKAAPELYEALKNLNAKTDANDWNYYEAYHADNLIARIKGEEIPFPEIYDKEEGNDG